MKKFILFLISAFLLTGCLLNENQQTERYFDHFPQWDTLIADYQKRYPTVDKYLKSDTSEAQKVVEVDWEDELHLFKLADINRLNLIPKYSIDTLQGNLSGTTTYRFKALKTDTRVQLAEYTFNDNNEWEDVHFVKSTENAAFETQQELWFTKNLNYRVVSRQKVNQVFDAQLIVEGHPVGTEREYLGILEIDQEHVVQFFMYRQGDSERTDQWFVQNGKERIALESKFGASDSNVLKFPIFHSELRYFTKGDTLMGWWYNFDKGKDYKMKFLATPYMKSRLLDEKLDGEPQAISGKWEVSFTDSDGDYPAIGIFEQKGNLIYGTFVTETGDYRHLEGFLANDNDAGEGQRLYLNTMDGAHAFHFNAVLRDDSLVDGNFLSGTHYKATWSARKSQNAALRDPSALTFLKAGYESFSFEFPNLNREPVSLNQPKFEDQVVLVSITGTWCPNCKDETEYLKQVYKKYGTAGLEVVALQFERSEDFETAKAAVEKANEDLPVPYTQLIAGKAGAQSAAEKLPMLNQIMSYPTLIVLNREHEVEKIHTGFYGPGTGEYYTEFTSEMDSLITRLLKD